MERWLVRVDGEWTDIEELPYWFPTGPVYAIAEDRSVYLVGEALEKHTEPSDVRNTAIQALDEFCSVISLLWPSFRRPTGEAVFRELADGRRTQHHLLAVSLTGRAKMRVGLSVAMSAKHDQGPTQAQQLLEASRSNTRLATVLVLWADPYHTWPRLYRIVEEIQKYLRGNPDNSNLCTANELKRFMRSANTASVAGKDARHADGEYAAPRNPMSLDDAVTFVRILIERTLRREIESRQPNDRN